jgi:hypothetical protein
MTEINAHLPLAGPRRGDELPDGATFERARIPIGIGYGEIGRLIDARLRHADLAGPARRTVCRRRPQKAAAISTSPLLDLRSRRKRPRLCATPKQIVAGHRPPAARGPTKCSPHMFGMLPGWQADGTTITTNIGGKS